jgi:glycoprotein endo-alpha-1,2-mannosidase
MRITQTILFFVLGCVVLQCSSDNEVNTTGPQAVKKSNATKIYVHYMPWFQSKGFSGYWGSHWRMANKNPENIDADGKREIASHYYPLIGPYDSKDPDVIIYHLLLMKYAGIDAVLFDWYGVHDVNDYASVLAGTNAMIDKLDEVGLQFGIVYEEYTAEIVADKTKRAAVQVAQEDVQYMQEKYFGVPQYVSINKKPLLLTFGPRYFKQPDQWTAIFSNVDPKPNFLPLWNHSWAVGPNSSGEYAWIDFNASLSELNNFYGKSSAGILMGSAFPGFHDFYEEGGWGTSYGYVPYNDGETLRNTLAAATNKNISQLQLVTWNDFGEGTVIEPTLENNFQCLEIIQEFTGVPYGREELQLIYDYYLKRVKYKNDTASQQVLTDILNSLASLKVDDAKKQMEKLP